MRPRFARFITLGLSIVLVAFSARVVAAPPNLVVNGDFGPDLLLQGWERVGTLMDSEWEPEDAAGNPQSGSVRVNGLFQPEFRIMRRQCTVLSGPSHAYVVGAAMRTDQDSLARGGVFARFSFHEDADCTVDSGYAFVIVAWEPMWSLRLEDIQLGAFGPASLSVMLGAYKTVSDEGEIAGHIDAVFAYADGLMRDGFDGTR